MRLTGRGRPRGSPWAWSRVASPFAAPPTRSPVGNDIAGILRRMQPRCQRYRGAYQGPIGARGRHAARRDEGGGLRLPLRLELLPPLDLSLHCRDPSPPLHRSARVACPCTTTAQAIGRTQPKSQTQPAVVLTCGDMLLELVHVQQPLAAADDRIELRPVGSARVEVRVRSGRVEAAEVGAPPPVAPPERLLQALREHLLLAERRDGLEGLEQVEVVMGRVAKACVLQQPVGLQHRPQPRRTPAPQDDRAPVSGGRRSPNHSMIVRRAYRTLSTSASCSDTAEGVTVRAWKDTLTVRRPWLPRSVK